MIVIVILEVEKWTFDLAIGTPSAADGGRSFPGSRGASHTLRYPP